MEPKFAHAWVLYPLCFLRDFQQDVPMEWANPEKTRTDGGEDMEFPGVSKK